MRLASCCAAASSWCRPLPGDAGACSLLAVRCAACADAAAAASAVPFRCRG